MRAAGRHLAPYSSAKSRKDFTQAQLLTCLVLRAITKNNYRGICELLLLSPALREAIGLTKVPHWTTLQKFMAKTDVPEIVAITLGSILEQVGAADRAHEVAVDSTGMQNGVQSLHYISRRWDKGGRSARKPIKVSVAIICGLLLPVALVVDVGASADMKQMPAIMEQLGSGVRPSRLLADAGYDAEWVHEVCREQWDTESLIPPVVRTADGSIKSKWRSRMRDLPASFGRRWHVESFFSALKRTTMGSLSSRTERTLVAEATIKVLAYAVRRDEVAV